METQVIDKIKFWAPTWGAWLPIQAVGLYSLYNLFLGDVVSHWWVYTIVGYMLLSVVGIAIGYHRYLSHRSFKTNGWWQRILIWCGIMSGQGSPVFWALIHRGYHHRLSDKPDDPHSPKHGFWHSYVGWLFKIKPVMNNKYVIDLIQNKDVAFAHRFYFPILWISNLVIFFVSPDAWMWGIMFPAFLTFHSYALNTSINHCTSLGYRNYNTIDDSTNVPWLWIFLLGDAWHNNHHRYAKDSNFKRRWWELDPAYWIICLIRAG